ncbi:MAG: hypothetical protein LUF26_05980, partial [Firmicutes bacterium]|nr:hypothetical protein [Bacillota bacterium]
NRRYIYAFKENSANTNIYVGFLTVDDFYTYMYDGFSISELPDDTYSTTDRNGESISYYFFEDVYANQSEGTGDDDITLTYDSSISSFTRSIKYTDSDYSIQSRIMFINKNSLGADWDLVLPEAYAYGYNYESDTSGSTKYYWYDYVCAFRSMDGSVYMFYGDDVFKKYSDSTTTYSASFTSDTDRNLSFESFFETQLLDDDIEYNFVITDSYTQLTYYLYNTGISSTKISSKQPMYITAVQDNYGNTITYEYEDGYGSISKIIDTYGREISIESITGGKQISYYDDIDGKTKTITYTTETLDASELDNDSPLKGKDINRFSVTNAEGETTIYDSRDTEVLNYYYSSNSSGLGYIDGLPDAGGLPEETSENSNIERIIYPTGAETRYTYQCVYPKNVSAKVAHGVYAVTGTYDIVDDEIVNQKEYALSKATVTETDSSVGSVTIDTYNSDYLVSTSITSATGKTSSTPYIKTTNSYTDNNELEKQVVNTSGTSKTTEYTYNTSYHGLLKSCSDGKAKVSYTYHTVNGKATKIPSKITYSYLDDDEYAADYYVTTSLTDDNNSIEYEKVIQDSVIKSQIKYEYDSDGNVTAIKQWTNDTDADGDLDEDDDIIVLENTYEITAQKTKNVTNTVADVLNADGDNEGDVTNTYKYNIYGSPLSQTDSYGTVTEVEYDDINRPVKYTMANGGTKTIEYNIDKNYTLVTDEAGVVTKYEYDGLGRSTATYIQNGTSYRKISACEYDEAGRIASQTSYRSGAAGVKEKYSYDVLGRVTEKQVYEYPRTLLYTETYTYKNSSSQATVTLTTTADGITTPTQTSYYDKYGRLTSQESTSDSTTITTSYEYDYQDRVISETDANGNTTSYEYTYDGQVSKQTNAAGDSVTSEYDLAGQVVSATDANGNITSTEYDSLGRPIRVVTPFSGSTNGETKTYYDKNSNIVKTAVKRASSLYQITEYKYDEVGNLLASIANDGSTDIVTQYEYDTANRVTKNDNRIE